jgi:hypothetical protein
VMRKSARSAVAAMITVFMMALSPAAADVTIEDPGDILDTTRVSVAARQAEIGADPERLFLFVRDRIAHDVYRGALRGGQGTLLSLSGNAVDKAVLLQELLKRAGHQARFARGTLDVPKAGVLLRAVFRRPSAPAASGGAVDPSLKAFLEAVRKDTTDQYRTIMRGLSDAGVPLPASAPRAVADDLRDHYWLQYRRGNAWVDLDPSFPEARAGQAFTTAVETRDALPESLFHRVVLRVVVEERKDGRLQRRPLLTYEAPAASLSGKTIVLAHQPGSWTQPVPESSLAGAVGGAVEAITGVLGALGGGGQPSPRAREDKAKPVLTIGDDYRMGQAFDIAHPQNEGSAAAATATGEWLEVEFRDPGGMVTKTDRMIFDRIGFAARQAGQTTGTTGALGVNHPLTSIFCLGFTTGPLLEPDIVAPASTAKTNTVAGSDERTVTQVVSLLAGINGMVALFGDRLSTPTDAGGQEAVYSVTSPRLIVSAFRSSPTATTISLDLRRTSYRPLTAAPAGGDKTFQLQVLRGVLDGVLESRVMGLLFPDGPSTADVAPGVYSTSTVFRAGQQANARTLVLKGGSGETRPALSPEAAARISADLGRGKVVLLPERTVTIDGRSRIAWWQVDRSSGATIGVTEDGLHQAGTEYVVVKQRDNSYVFYRVAGTGKSRFTAKNVSVLRNLIDTARLANWKLYGIALGG